MTTLTVHVDPALLQSQPAASPPTFPTVVEMPQARAPETGTLLFAAWFSASALTGALRPLKVIAKQGTIVWADPGRPVTLCTSHPSNEIPIGLYRVKISGQIIQNSMVFQLLSYSISYCGFKNSFILYL